MRRQPLDFIQVTYNPLDREVEQRILPLARDRGMAVIINRPFQEGSLIRRVQGRPLPDWARDIDARSWAQIILKFVMSHPAVTCTIPATSVIAQLQAVTAASSAPTSRRVRSRSGRAGASSPYSANFAAVTKWRVVG